MTSVLCDHCGWVPWAAQGTPNTSPVRRNQHISAACFAAGNHTGWRLRQCVLNVDARLDCLKACWQLIVLIQRLPCRIRRPGDKVHVVYSTSGSSTQSVLESYQAILHKLKVIGAALQLPLRHAEPV